MDDHFFSTPVTASPLSVEEVDELLCRINAVFAANDGRYGAASLSDSMRQAFSFRGTYMVADGPPTYTSRRVAIYHGAYCVAVTHVARSPQNRPPVTIGWGFGHLAPKVLADLRALMVMEDLAGAADA